MRLLKVQEFVQDHTANVSLMETVPSTVLGVNSGDSVHIPVG